MEFVSVTKNWIEQLQQRLKKTGDLEPGQAMLRITIGVLVVIYIFLPIGSDDSFSKVLFTLGGINFSLATSMSLLYTSCSLLIMGAILINPVASPIRRITGITLDAVALSFLMYHSGDGSVPLFFIYLWIILGNGFRYGVRYLYICQAVSIIGFFAVVTGGEYWLENQSFAISLFMMLCLIPLYAAFLLKKLHAAIDMARQANEAKSRFLANMSHELRTPLNGVIGMGELLRETKLTHEQRELVGSMHSSANTLLELIENILDISKIEAGKILVESKDFDLHNLVNSVLLMLAPLGERKGLQVSCHFDPETPFELKGDERYLHQVLVNLINNAIKFTNSGSVVLSIRLVSGSLEEPVIRFEIRDTGIGIEPEVIDKIFDNFTQADASTSRSYGGTGLGTTISKELVHLMGGTIGVESTVKKGSTFWFELPFTIGDHSQTSIAENRILLLASEETASIVRPALKSWDVKFEWVRSTARALSSLVQANDDNNPYETVIVDQSCLNDLNAVQFSQMVKSENKMDNTAMVLINSSDTMIDANKTSQFYISTIESPEDKRQLFNAIHAALSINPSGHNIITMADHYANYTGTRGLRILVAEDNLVNQQVIQGILKNVGHDILIANTGDQAMEIISRELDSIDLILMDMNMPEISGIEVVKALRFLDPQSRIPVVMLTADATPEAKEASLNAGANKFLTKPVDSRRLLKVIALLTRKSEESIKPKQKPPLLKQKSDIRFTTSQWYNNSVLEELYILGGSEPSFILSLIKNFCSDGSKHILRIKASIDDDYLSYRESLHALKGSSTELGADKLVEICINGESLKPYDLGSEKIFLFCENLEEDFNNTVTALTRAVTECKKQTAFKAGDI